MPRSLLLSVLSFALLSKLLLFFWAAYDFPFDTRPESTPLSIWQQWDAHHYMRIAEAGYSKDGISLNRFQFLSHFPPVYPLVVAGTARLSGLPILSAGMLVSLLSGMLSAYLLASLTWYEFADRRTVFWTNALFHLYPVSYFLVTPYSESLFFVFVLLFFHCVRVQQNLPLAGLAAAAAIGTRLMGVNLLPVLGLYVLHKVKQRSAGLGDAFALLAPLAAIGSYLLLNHYVWGNWLYFLQHVYEDPLTPRQPIIPLGETFRVTKEFLSGVPILASTYTAHIFWGAAATLFVLTITLWGALRRLVPFDYTLYSLSYILFYSSFNWGISNGRYSFGAFSIFMILAQMKPRLSVWFWVLPFTAGMLYFSKQYVWEYWAF